MPNAVAAVYLASRGRGAATGLLGWMLDGLDDGQRGQALDALGATISRHKTTAGVRTTREPG